MNVSVIIPNYNGAELLKNNIPQVIKALEDYKDGFVELIVPDDASKDNSLEILKILQKKYKNSKTFTFKVIESPFKINGGFSANVNRGVSYATGDLLLLLNSDVIPYKNFINFLLPHFKDSNVFAVGCMDESIEEGKIVLRGRGTGAWSKGFVIHKKLDTNGSSTFWVSGGSSIFRKSIWDKIGGLNNIYNPFYWEDIDLSYRAQKAGYKVIFEPKSRVIHEHEKGSIKTSTSASRVTTTAYRNQCFFVWLNITDLNLIFSHLIWLPYHVLIALKNRNKEFLNGFWAALLKLPAVLLERNKNKKLFIVSDEDIFKSQSK